jgi:Cysteine rich repeat
MSKLRLAVLVLAIGCSGSAFAQSGDGRGACASDYEKFCVGTPPGSGRVVACLTKKQNQLSDACKKVLASRKAK